MGQPMPKIKDDHVMVMPRITVMSAHRAISEFAWRLKLRMELSSSPVGAIVSSKGVMNEAQLGSK